MKYKIRPLNYYFNLIKHPLMFNLDKNSNETLDIEYNKEYFNNFKNFKNSKMIEKLLLKYDL